MGNAYSRDNEAWRKKLESLAGRLSDEDFLRPAGDHGWTVGGVLAHMAFYDYRVLAILERWKTSAIGPSPHDTDIINDAMKPLFNAVRPAELRRIVVEAARAVDVAIDGLDPGFLARIDKEGTEVRLSRAHHREHHLGQIEKALSAR